MKNFINVCITLLFISLPIQPISRNAAYGITAGIGITTFIIASKLTRNAAFSLLSTIPTSILTYFATMSITPEGRFKLALKKTSHIEKYPFAQRSYEAIDTFINDLQNQFYDHFWLITAHNNIELLLKEGFSALELLMLCQQDVNDDYDFLQKIHILNKKIRSYINNLTSALRFIKKHPDFKYQRSAYYQLLIEKERLSVEREAVSAQNSQAAAQIAQAHAQYSQAQAMRNQKK